MNDIIQEHCNKGIFPEYAVLDAKFSCPAIIVYKNPEDFPTQYVARIWDLADGLKASEYFITKNTLEEIKREVPESMKWFERYEQDDTCIVGTYI